MNATIIIIVAAFSAAVAVAVTFVILRNPRKTDEKETALLMLQNRIDSLAATVDKKLGESNAATIRQLSDSQKFVQEMNRDMQKHLSEVARAVAETNEGSKQVLGITEELHNLQKVLTNQKHRGNLGEAGLELILNNILPTDSYQTQYSFKNGDKADAVIKTRDGLIPVDAKFSLDNYTRLLDEKDEGARAELEKEFSEDLKKRINETAKYIRPAEGTLPFAMMFIPAEGIYYDLLVNEIGAVKSNTRSLIDYAYKDKNVIIVSPTTFSAYLRAVLYGFRAFKIEESARDISKRVEDLGKHLKAYEEFYNKLGATLGTAVGHYNSASKELGKIDKDIAKIAGAPAGFETSLLDKPSGE